MIARVLGAAVFLIAAVVPAAAQDDLRGTAEEAQELVARAVALYDEVGLNETLRRITLSDDFRYRDLYVFVMDTAGTIAAHSRAPHSIGSNALGAVDRNGVYYVRDMIERATPKGVWVDYIFPDPVTGKPAPKSTWAVRHDMFIFACGIYAGEIGI
jgi:signal transduction histidine kinase